MLAKGITEERILGNLAEIAFDKENHNVDRTRALELLGKQQALWIDRTQTGVVSEPKEFSDAEMERLKAQAEGLTSPKITKIG